MVKHPNLFGIIQDKSEVCQPPESELMEYDFDRCRVCVSGRNCRKCLRGDYKISPSSRLVPLPYETQELKHRRQKRFYMRCALGIEVALENGNIVRAFTLTESDYALGMGLDFGKAWNKLLVKMRYDYGGVFPYCLVEHEQGDRQRRNRHVICYGTGLLDQVALDEHWRKVYGSVISGMERVWSPRGLAFYLSKYLTSSSDSFVRAIMSTKWVFQGWWKFNLAYHRLYGAYPNVEVLAALSRMSPSVVECELEWLLETGSMSQVYLGERG